MANKRHKLAILTPQEHDALQSKYLQGISIDSLAAEYSCARRTIIDYMHKHGVKRQHRVVETLTQEQQAAIHTLYKQECSFRTIGKKVGITDDSVKRYLKKAGLYVPRHPSRGSTHRMWKGGRIVVDGYIKVLLRPTDPYYCMANTTGYVLEHRYVMAKHLGRPLTGSETVHHINGNRQDNSLDNLELRQGNHGKGVVMCCLECGSQNIGTTTLGR